MWAVNELSSLLYRNDFNVLPPQLTQHAYLRQTLLYERCYNNSLISRGPKRTQRNPWTNPPTGLTWASMRFIPQLHPPNWDSGVLTLFEHSVDRFRGRLTVNGRSGGGDFECHTIDHRHLQWPYVFFTTIINTDGMKVVSTKFVVDLVDILS